MIRLVLPIVVLAILARATAYAAPAKLSNQKALPGLAVWHIFIMELKKLMIASSLAAITLLSTHQAHSDVKVHVNEKYGRKTIHGYGKGRLNQNVVVMAIAYLDKDKDKWIPAAFVAIFIQSVKKQGKTITRPPVAQWKLLKPRDKVSIYTAKRKIEGYIHASAGSVFSLVMKPSDFKDFARSDKATLVCRKTKLTFNQSALVDMRGMADEMEKNSNQRK